MSNVLYVDDDLGSLIEFKKAFEHSGVEVDLACGLLTGLARLNDARLSNKTYDLVFVDENLKSHEITGGLWGAEYLQRRARILNPGIVAVEFVSGPNYNRRVTPNHSLMKPMIYRAKEICDILEKTRERENA